MDPFEEVEGEEQLLQQQPEAAVAAAIAIVEEEEEQNNNNNVNNNNVVVNMEVVEEEDDDDEEEEEEQNQNQNLFDEIKPHPLIPVVKSLGRRGTPIPLSLFYREIGCKRKRNGISTTASSSDLNGAADWAMSNNSSSIDNDIDEEDDGGVTTGSSSGGNNSSNSQRLLGVYRRFKLPAGVRTTFHMDFSSDGKLIASCHGDHAIYVSNVNTLNVIRVLRGHPRTPWTVTFHPTQPDILASGCLAGHVRVWDLKGGSELLITESNSVIASLAFHPSVRLLAIACGNEIIFWDWSRGSVPLARVGTGCLREKLRAVRFSGDGSFLLTGITNGIVTTEQQIHQQSLVEIPPPPHAPQSSTTTASVAVEEEILEERQDRFQESYRQLVSHYEDLVSHYHSFLRTRIPRILGETAAAAAANESSISSSTSSVEPQRPGPSSSSSSTTATTATSTRTQTSSSREFSSIEALAQNILEMQQLCSQARARVRLAPNNNTTASAATPPGNNETNNPTHIAELQQIRQHLEVLQDQTRRLQSSIRQTLTSLATGSLAVLRQSEEVTPPRQVDSRRFSRGNIEISFNSNSSRMRVPPVTRYNENSNQQQQQQQRSLIELEEEVTLEQWPDFETGLERRIRFGGFLGVELNDVGCNNQQLVPVQQYQVQRRGSGRIHQVRLRRAAGGSGGGGGGIGLERGSGGGSRLMMNLPSRLNSSFSRGFFVRSVESGELVPVYQSTSSGGGSSSSNVMGIPQQQQQQQQPLPSTSSTTTTTATPPILLPPTPTPSTSTSLNQQHPHIHFFPVQHFFPDNPDPTQQLAIYHPTTSSTTPPSTSTSSNTLTISHTPIPNNNNQTLINFDSTSLEIENEEGNRLLFVNLNGARVVSEISNNSSTAIQQQRGIVYASNFGLLLAALERNLGRSLRRRRVTLARDSEIVGNNRRGVVLSQFDHHQGEVLSLAMETAASEVLNNRGGSYSLSLSRPVESRIERVLNSGVINNNNSSSSSGDEEVNNQPLTRRSTGGPPPPHVIISRRTTMIPVRNLLIENNSGVGGGSLGSSARTRVVVGGGGSSQQQSQQSLQIQQQQQQRIHHHRHHHHHHHHVLIQQQNQQQNNNNQWNNNLESSSTTSRVQKWDFSKFIIPDLRDRSHGLVVGNCLLQSDSCLCLSPSTDSFIAVLTPPPPLQQQRQHQQQQLLENQQQQSPLLSISTYSLLPSNLGQKLNSYNLQQNSVSVSISFSEEFILVGYAGRGLRFANLLQQQIIQNSNNNNSKIIGQILQIKDNEEELIPLHQITTNSVNNNGNNNNILAINCMHFLPSSGRGLVYGSNTGDLVMIL